MENRLPSAPDNVLVRVVGPYLRNGLDRVRGGLICVPKVAIKTKNNVSAFLVRQSRMDKENGDG